MSPEAETAWLSETSAGARLAVLVNPRSARRAIMGLHDGRLKIALEAPPVEGAANAALVEFLAKLAGLPKSQVSVEAGQSGRRKTLLLAGISAAALRARLEPLLPSSR